MRLVTRLLKRATPRESFIAVRYASDLTALLLAHDWFGDSFLEASRRLDGKRTGDFLRIFKDVERMDLAPPQGNHMNGVLGVSAAVQQRCGPVPLHEHGGIPRPAFDPDGVDREMKIGKDARGARTSGAAFPCRG